MPRRLRFTTLCLLLVAALPLLLIACSDDKKDKPSGPPVGEDEYMASFCTGLSTLSTALISKPTAAEISTVIKAYVADMKKLVPPKDLEKFHSDYMKFLEDSVDDPTSVLTRKPPVPDDKVRQHYAEVEARTPACKDARYFVQS